MVLMMAMKTQVDRQQYFSEVKANNAEWNTNVFYLTKELK